MHIEPNVVIAEFIVNLNDVYSNFDNTNMNVAKQIKE